VSALRRQPQCERAREWASLEIDGELSAFERFLLHSHLDSCESCSEFRAGAAEFTEQLRAARLEVIERPVAVQRRRRAASFSMARAVAAAAVVAVGLGSILASSELQNEPDRYVRGSSSSIREIDMTTNLIRRAGEARRQIVLERAKEQRVLPTRPGQLRGGPVR
jgi:hypothetical protein